MTRALQVRPGSELARQHAQHLERLRRNFAGPGSVRAATPVVLVREEPVDRTVRAELPALVMPSAPIVVLTKSLVDAAASAARHRKPTCEMIIQIGCRHFGISRNDVLSDRRTRPLVRWRQIIIFVMKEHTLRSLPDIGRRVGGRDHTTVLHAVRQIERMIQGGDKDIIEHVEALRAAIAGAIVRQCEAELELSEEVRTENQPTDLMGECNGTSGHAV